MLIDGDECIDGAGAGICLWVLSLELELSCACSLLAAAALRMDHRHPSKQFGATCGWTKLLDLIPNALFSVVKLLSLSQTLSADLRLCLCLSRCLQVTS